MILRTSFYTSCNIQDYSEAQGIEIAQQRIQVLRKKFNLTDKPHDDDTKIIVVNTNGIKVGFVVDSVEEILQIEEEVIEVAPAIVAGINRKYIKSVAKVEQRMIVLIDIDLVVTDEEKISLGEVIAEV